MAWEVEPEKKNRAVPAWSSLAPSELVRTVHSQQANGKGRDVQDRSEGKGQQSTSAGCTAQMGCVQILSLRDSETRIKSFGLFEVLIPVCKIGQ